MRKGSPYHRRGSTAVALLAFLVLAFSCFTEEKKRTEEAPLRNGAEKIDHGAAREREARIGKAAAELSRWIRVRTYPPLVPSAAAVVVEGDRVIFRETARTTPDTPFMMASLTKTFVAISIMQLADRRMLSFDDPIGTYLGVEFENRELASEPITIWHLLTHTSGLVEDPSPRFAAGDYPFTVPQQRYPAGSRFNYCNQGYNLLGFLVFEVSGLSLGEYVTRYILKPLEMHDSRAPATTRGAAGIACSINDLANYLAMFMGGGSFKGRRVISKRMFRKMVSETIESPPARKKEYRGICFRIWTVDDTINSMHHAAHMPGAGGFMQFFPRKKVGYVFISNPPQYDREEFYAYYNSFKSRMIRFSKVVMGDDAFDPMTFQPDKPSREQLHLFAGRYTKSDDGKVVVVEVHPGGYLTALKTYTGARYAISPTSLHTFVYIYPGQTEKGEIYDFVMKDGKIVGLGVKDGYFIKQCVTE
ncbi:MAG: beta-lactamase family protein [Spirochaetes bacterium]|nr:beta-lactamase family protein [Spirochaetota bacterium]